MIALLWTLAVYDLISLVIFIYVYIQFPKLFPDTSIGERLGVTIFLSFAFLPILLIGLFILWRSNGTEEHNDK